VHEGLPEGANTAGERAGVDVSGKQRDLIEDQAGGPDGSRTAEPRQQAASDERLEPEEQKGAQKNSGRG